MPQPKAPINLDSVLTDIRYAMKQLQSLVAAPATLSSPRLAVMAANLESASGRVQRAIDALERIEEHLTNEEEG